LNSIDADWVTIVTITRDRTQLLKRAIKSVRAQDYDGPLAHLVVIDRCFPTLQFIKTLRSSAIAFRWYVEKNKDLSVYGHIAALRNFGVQESRTKWISFLDDDDELEKNHISSLVSCARESNCRAVHSYMQILTEDGLPYLEPKHPWTRDPVKAKETYEKLRKQGVFQLGSNIAKDRVDSLDHPDPVRSVDMSEWLFERSLLLDFPFDTDYDLNDWTSVTTDDDKFLNTLVAQRIPVACTKLPTFKYYLGGHSNNFRKYSQFAYDPVTRSGPE